MSLLNERERILLNLSRQGLNSNEISETLCRSKHTIQNQIKALFVKLNVHSIQEAIERANHCNLLHPYKDKKQILGKLKLNKLSENELEKREMRILKGGSDCPDGCSPNTSISNATVDKYS